MEKEVQFQILDEEVVRENIAKLGFKPYKQCLLRDIYFSPTGKWETSQWFIRLRDDGEKAELTYKSHLEKGDIQKREELNLGIDSYEKAKVILSKIDGFKVISEKETKREYLKKDDMTFEFMEVIKPEPFKFSEIEASSNNKIEEVLKVLGDNIKIISQEDFPK